MNYKLFSLFVVANFLLPSLSPAQRMHCRARVRANRHKTVEFVSKSWAGAVWENEYGRIEQDFLPDGTDSVTADYTGHVPVIFHAKKNGEIAESSIEYMGKGGWLTDTVIRSRTGARHGYYDVFYSSNVAATRNEQLHWLRLYNAEGGDSLMINRFDNGLLQRMEWYNGNGAIALAKDWTSDGILRKSVSDTITSEYSDNGVLHSELFDTVIEEHGLKCSREYYDNGILKSVAFFANDTPCHIWRYYDAEGRLEKTVKKVPVSSLAISQKGAVYSIEPTIFTVVEQHAEYPGDDAALKRYIDEQLPEALCTCEAKLRGGYKLNVCVKRSSGEMHLVSVVGENAEAARLAMEPVIGRGAHWRCAKICGRPADQLITLDILVK